MLKRILLAWVIANFAIAGLVSWMSGGWYLGWRVSPVVAMLAELGLIIAPNLILPILALRYWWSEPLYSIKDALGWQWKGWRSIAVGLVVFVIFYGLVKVAVEPIGNSIPYNLTGDAGIGITIEKPLDALILLGLLFGLIAFTIITVVGEETMFRGWIQTQVGKRHGILLGIMAGAVLFGLRHLPADLFYGGIWQATPQMWLSRQVELYLFAICLGLARYYGKSTYASAITHGLTLVTAIYGIG